MLRTLRRTLTALTSGARPPTPRLARLATLTTLGVAAAAIGMSGCSSDDTSASADGCQSTRTFFETQVWSPFMGSACFKCHGPGGEAQIKNAKFKLQPTAYPNFIDANLANLADIANHSVDGVSELLVKPLGGDNHGGGQILTEDSPEYAALTELVTRLQAGGDSCTEPADTTLGGVKNLAATQTLRKAALDLGGRLPTAAEMASVQKGGDAALDKVLDQLMTEDTFSTRLREIWNDIMLTDKYWLAYSGAAIDVMNTDQMYPALAKYKDDQNPAYVNRGLVNQAIAQEPLNLLTYIVKNDKPFTEIVSADYTVVNPYLADAYGLDVHFDDPTNYDEWHEAQVTLGTGVKLPHAGMMSTPVFLNRWQTTPTNRDRGRARRLFSFFLATDVLQIATRPVDATKITSVDNPTLNSDSCTVCHSVIDPVAAAFRGYGESDYEYFDADAAQNGWYKDMFEAGFNGTPMDSSRYQQGMQWMGEQIANDPRFLTNAVVTTLKGLTARDPLMYPQDNTDPEFGAKLAAWSAQDQFIRDTVSKFQQNKLNLKTIVKEIVKSPYYRGITAADGGDAATLDGIGGGRLLTPEMLSRKVQAIMGFVWRPNYSWDQDLDNLQRDYKLTYGGIDSNAVIARLSEPNGIMSAVQNRLANEVACHAVAWDFWKSTGDRNLFPLVELDESPESAGHAVAGSVDDIKANIVHLHSLILGEDLSKDDPEVERTYQLFLDTWHELSTSGSTSVPYECQGRWDWSNGEPLTPGTEIGDDQNFTMRSWQAVVTYLLSDYSFLYQ